LANQVTRVPRLLFAIFLGKKVAPIFPSVSPLKVCLVSGDDFGAFSNFLRKKTFKFQFSG